MRAWGFRFGVWGEGCRVEGLPAAHRRGRDRAAPPHLTRLFGEKASLSIRKHDHGKEKAREIGRERAREKGEREGGERERRERGGER